jgi:hypothetical protein
MHEADALAAKYGSRPPYNGLEFAQDKRLTQDQAIHAAPYVLACESRNQIIETPSGCIVDSNHKLSCGPAQLPGRFHFLGTSVGDLRQRKQQTDRNRDHAVGNGEWVRLQVDLQSDTRHRE